MNKEKTNPVEKLKNNDFKKVDNLVVESKKKGFATKILSRRCFFQPTDCFLWR